MLKLLTKCNDYLRWKEWKNVREAVADSVFGKAQIIKHGEIGDYHFHVEAKPSIFGRLCALKPEEIYVLGYPGTYGLRERRMHVLLGDPLAEFQVRIGMILWEGVNNVDLSQDKSKIWEVAEFTIFMRTVSSILNHAFAMILLGLMWLAIGGESMDIRIIGSTLCSSLVCCTLMNVFLVYVLVKPCVIWGED